MIRKLLAHSMATCWRLKSLFSLTQSQLNTCLGCFRWANSRDSIIPLSGLIVAKTKSQTERIWIWVNKHLQWSISGNWIKEVFYDTRVFSNWNSLDFYNFVLFNCSIVICCLAVSINGQFVSFDRPLLQCNWGSLTLSRRRVVQLLIKCWVMQCTVIDMSESLHGWVDIWARKRVLNAAPTLYLILAKRFNNRLHEYNLVAVALVFDKVFEC